VHLLVRFIQTKPFSLSRDYLAALPSKLSALAPPRSCRSLPSVAQLELSTARIAATAPLFLAPALNSRTARLSFLKLVTTDVPQLIEFVFASRNRKSSARSLQLPGAREIRLRRAMRLSRLSCCAVWPPSWALLTKISTRPRRSFEKTGHKSEVHRIPLSAREVAPWELLTSCASEKARLAARMRILLADGLANCFKCEGPLQHARRTAVALVRLKYGRRLGSAI